MDFIWLTLRTNGGGVCVRHVCVFQERENPVFTKRSFLMGWLIWQLSDPLSEVHLTVQGFAISLDAAGKPGVFLPRCHPESTA